MKGTGIMRTTQPLLVAMALLGLVALAGPAEARIGTIDNVPAATLLLPYFEVDLGNTAGLTTLLSINNASATAVLAHVTVWSDLAVPTFAFNIYLTGYDVQTINLRDIFNGTVPRTASDGQDPTDTISHQGIFSQDINFASCNGVLPPPPLLPEYIAHVRAAHTGQPAGLFLGLCASQAFGDNIARGYVTVDTVNNCTLQVAGDPGYFASNITFQNVLWGDYFYVNPGENFAQGDALVHIESAPGTGTSGTAGTYPPDPETAAGQYTFYARYVAVSGPDSREPLNSKSAARFINGGAFNGGTSLVVWRDSKVDQGPFLCPAVSGTRPPAYPLAHEELYAFSESETAENLTGLASPFPASTQRVRVDGPSLPVTPTFGWIYLDLNHNTLSGVVPAEDPAAAQSWVGNVMDAQGRFSVGQGAVVLESAKAVVHTCIGDNAPAPCP
jgi:hypothetical protein